MKKYDYQWFKDEDQMLEWLNSHQDINVISIIYIEVNLSYRVFYYIEKNQLRLLSNEINIWKE